MRRWMLAEPIVKYNHFTIHVNQTIMLYALNLYRDVSVKLEKKKKKKICLKGLAQLGI